MATIPGPARGLSRLAAAGGLALLLLPTLVAAEQPRPVAFYDGEAVVARAATLVGADVRLARLVERHEAEVAALRDEVDALRDELAHAAVLPVAARREVEARLAQRTIALLVEQTEGEREIEDEERHLADGLRVGVASVVARVAHERDLPVVIRTNAHTRVLDRDAVDLTDAVLAALGAGAAPDERGDDAPGTLRARARLQACAPAGDDAATLAAR